jgi:hypothetical protein
MVSKVEYREFTGRLRHAAWKGVRRVAPTLAVVPAVV